MKRPLALAAMLLVLGACERPEPLPEDPREAVGLAAETCRSGDLDRGIDMLDRLMANPDAPSDGWAIRGLCLWQRFGRDSSQADVEQAYVDYTQAILAVEEDAAVSLDQLYAQRARIIEDASPGDHQAALVD